MPRRTATFPCPDKGRLLAWAAAWDCAVYLDSNDYPLQTHRSWDCLAAVGRYDAVSTPAGAAFPALKRFYDEKQDWLFGFFSYDLKNEVERLASNHPDGIGLPDLFFFQPEIVAGIRDGRLEVHSLTEAPEAVWHTIQTADSPKQGNLVFNRRKEGEEIFTAPRASKQALLPSSYPPFQKNPPEAHPVDGHASALPSRVTPRLPRPDYLAAVEAVREHIAAGDVYELNLCQEFYAENLRLAPLAAFERLNARARAPFAAFLRLDDHYLLCASPERFLRKEGDRLLSQPIKGTRPRGATPADDARIRAELADSEKDRAENVMIVDLVRNDLARHCRPGSVQVDELFGIYTFETVHQMISTVSGRLLPAAHPLDALRDAFPMGSMTGAPKVMAMQLIERYERTRRGLYSGALGYFAPGGDFDFNVVIRSILYNAASGYASAQVGGAIVYDSVPELEYEECLVKARAMLGILEEFGAS